MIYSFDLLSQIYNLEFSVEIFKQKPWMKSFGAKMGEHTNMILKMKTSTILFKS